MQRLRIVVALTFIACGPSANHGNSATTPADSDATCQQETATGTNFDKRVCRSDAQREAERKAARDLYLDPQYRPGVRR